MPRLSTTLGASLAVGADRDLHAHRGCPLRTRRDSRAHHSQQQHRDAQVRWAPGGGRLQGLLRYTNTIDWFETEYLKAANSMGHEGMLDMSWRWLPKTALYLQVRQGYIST